MDEQKWISWKLQTSKTWSDMEDVLMLINIDFIDYDHQKLVEYALKLNNVIDKMEISFSIELVNETKHLLHNLYDYAVEHFDREELFMENYNLPEIVQHKREHKRILTMLKESLDDFQKGKINISHKLKIQVMDWLIKHINIVDHNYFDIDNWSKHLVDASDWDEVKAIVRLTGIEEIDEQHKIFTTMAIEVMQSISRNPNESLIRSELLKFKNYALMHFDYESKFMAKYKIKETRDHLELHDYFINRVDKFPEEIMNNPDKIDELKSWILKWWITHINQTDRETFGYKNWAYRLIDESSTIDQLLVALRLTGIDDVDSDHIELMKVALDLNNKIKIYTALGKNLYDDSVKNQLLAIFDQLYRVAQNHFTREEKIMADMRLTDIHSHIIEHKNILNKIETLRSNYTNNRLYISTNIKTMILEWWIQHTNTVDYRTFVQNKTIDNFKKEEDGAL